MSITYDKTIWVNDVTPVNQTNLNKIESGIKECVNEINRVAIVLNDDGIFPETDDPNVIYHFVGITNETLTNDKYYRWVEGVLQEVSFLGQATATSIGGIKAGAYNGEIDRNECKINASTGKLYTQMKKIQDEEIVEAPSSPEIYHQLTFDEDYTPIYRKDDRSLAEPTVFDYELIHENNINTYKLMAQEELSGTELTANKSYYKTLTDHLTGITLSGATSGKLNHWHLVTINGGTPYNVGFTTTIKWNEALPTFEANKTYEFSIVRVGTTGSFTYLGSWVKYT